MRASTVGSQRFCRDLRLLQSIFRRLPQAQGGCSDVTFFAEGIRKAVKKIPPPAT